MSLTHYIDVMIRAADIGHEIHARLLAASHKAIKANNVVLGVAWPDWKEFGGEFGFIFRVFGDCKALDIFSDLIGGLVDRGLVRKYPILEAPETIGKVAYLRDRTSEKQTKGFLVRAARRNEKYGRPISSEKKKLKPLSEHRLTMQSDSTGEQFAIFIVRSKMVPENCGGKQYGFGYLLPDF